MQVTPSPALLEALSALDSTKPEPRPAARAAAQAPPADKAVDEAPQRSGPLGHLGRFLDITV